ncbi:interferon-induced, double-stranded RNA-activated protein kinase [Notechis scutatus]|uniref:non-specific serine/threonine protein kinase n=1 Tax=Notechis scutatus TaxID=8663 RepID=A0A6J1U2Y4_9SAUR|nr:interferon-induced, double-stranded RNA-activated protein kinase [Notechis scutatus]
MLISILGYNMADNQIDPCLCMAKLNEHCQKNFLQLEYRDIYNTASSHDHLFTVAVFIDKVQYESATGKTKKEAKALAAVLAWNTIQEQKKGELDSCEQHKEPISYVSWLYEYASKNNVKIQYNCISKTGVQHKPVYFYVCQIGDKEFDVGRGNKVKAAKNEAAKLAYEKLTRSSTFGAEECTNSISDSSETTFSSSQGLSTETFGSTTDLDLELEKSSDTITQHAEAIQLNESSSSQNAGELDSCEQHKEPKLSLLSPSVPEFTLSNPINYVSWLNEYASKNNVKIQYNLESKTGVQHKPVFSFVCQIGDKVFDVGRGNKVKAAKNEAAKLAYEKLTRSSTFGAEECTNPFSDSSDVTSSSSQSLSNEASGSSTDLDLELEKTSDTLTEHADAIQLNGTSSSQNAVSPPSQSVKPKRKETPLAARFSNLSTRTSKFTKNDRFLQEFVDIEEIGSGGFGNVFKAKNTLDCRLCAIKRILSNKTEDETREVKALAILDHPHIVRYYNCWNGEDIFQFPDTVNSSSEKLKCLFIQMELCEKGNLSDWLDKKKGDSCKDVSIILFQQIVEGVDYIHSKNLIHRDLKPLNVFFHDENHIKIGDFGLVTVGVTNRQRTMNKGTWNYMAPEQEGSSYDNKVDIFPLGLILYEMLSPFYTVSEKYQEWPNIKEGNLPKTFTKKFTKETSLIKQLLSKKPSERPSAADILKTLKGQPHILHTY